MNSNEDEIERLSQALALVEGFQILILECHDLESWRLHVLLDLVQARVAKLRGIPPLIVTYDPRLTTDAAGSLRDEAWVEGILEPILELSAAALTARGDPWPFPDAKPEPGDAGQAASSVIAVIDGTNAVTDDRTELRSWAFLFHHINERRNALSREFRGTLALALTVDLVRLFLAEAPDTASIRSGHFQFHPVVRGPACVTQVRDLLEWYPAHLVRDAVLRRLASDQRLSPAARRDLAHDFHHSEVDRYWRRNSNGAHLALHELLRNLFSVDELWRFARVYFDPDIVLSFSGPTADDLVAQLIDGVRAGGVPMRSFFEFLARERPARYPEIARVASQWGYEVLPRSPKGEIPSPSDLFTVLVQLPRERLEQVVLLADLNHKGRALPSEAARLKARTRLTAREIVVQASREGPEALQQLAEAVEILASRDAPYGDAGSS